MEFWEANLRSLQTVLTNPLGIAGLLALGLVALLAINNRFLAMLLMAGLFFSVSTAPRAMVDAYGNYETPLIEPFQMMRQNARVLTACMVAALLPMVLTHLKDFSSRSLASLFFVLMIGTFQISLIVRSGFEVKPILVAGIALVLWFVVTSVRVQTIEDWYRAWVPPIYACLAYIGTNVVLVLASDGIRMGNRLSGFSSNPQFTAQALAVSVVLLSAAIADKRLRQAVRLPVPVLVAAACIATGLLGWTGSRGGMIIGAVGIMTLFGMKLGRAGLVGIPLAVGAYVVVNWLASSGNVDILESSGRLLDTTNTRAGPWALLWADFMSSPIFGTGKYGEAGFAESSYLLFAAQNGLLGLIPLLVGVVLVGLEALKGLSAFRQTGRKSLSLRLPLAMFALVAVGAAAEAFLISTFHLLVFVFLLSAQLGRLAPAVALQAEMQEAEHDWPDYDEEPSPPAVDAPRHPVGIL